MTSGGIEKLRTFFASAAAARAAARPLAREAEVAVLLDGRAARFTMESGAPALVEDAARDPDFTVVLSERAVDHITSIESDDVGEFGVAFFTLVLSRDPELKARIRVHASTPRLLGRGYLGVMALGGAKVSWWLVKNGVRNPKAAIDRLRNLR